MSRKKAVVICPGRGTYNREELGYLAKHHAKQQSLIKQFDGLRSEQSQIPISDLDGASAYSITRFSRGDNASPLIYSCAYADFLAIDREQFDIVAITGNSMGWYIAAACAESLSGEAGFQVTNTMGRLMHESLIGGQILYPFVDENWVEIPGKHAQLIALASSIHGLSVSIELGGMIVFAGEATALDACEAVLQPVQSRYPMRLHNHSAFHSSLQEGVARQGRELLSANLFEQPNTALVDGTGRIWFPKATDPKALYEYTLGQQVVETYDFSAAISTCLREFSPDVLITLGPGNTLGGAVAQCLIANRWHNLQNKQDFLALQSSTPFLLSMGLEDQRKWVLPDLKKIT